MSPDSDPEPTESTTLGVLRVTHPVAAIGLVGAPATADTVNSNAGNCPSQNSVMTSTDWQASNGYLCAQENHNGDTSIGPDDTHTWTIDTNVDYYPQYNCYDTTSSSVTVTPAFIFGSGSFTATNWLAASSTEDNTRHWSAGMLWTLGAGSVTGFSNGCEVSDQTWTDPPNILTVTKFTATGMPDNDQAVAGQAYDITVTFSPGDVTGSVGLMDVPTGSSGTPTAVTGATIENGTATFTWIPAQAGDRTVTIGYEGDATHTGAITDDIDLSVTNGVSLAITDIEADATAGTATATVAVGPSSLTSDVLIIDTNQVNPSTGKPPLVVGKAAASGGSASIDFEYAPGTNHKYVASVMNGSNQVIGQSYYYQWASPPTMTLTVPSVMQLNFRYPFMVGFSPESDESTTTLLQNGTAVASVSNTGGTEIPLYYTASALGSDNYQATYAGSSSMGSSKSPVGSSTVGNGYTLKITDVSCPSVNCTVKVQATGTAGNFYNGPISLYSNVENEAYPPGGLNGTEVATKTATNGYASFSVQANAWGYQATAAIIDSADGFLFSNTKTVIIGAQSAPATEDKPTKPTKPTKPHGHPGHGTAGTPGKHPAGYGVPTNATTVDKTKKIKDSKSRNRKVKTKCPSGYALLHAEAMSDGPKGTMQIEATKRGATFRAPKSDVGHKMRTQLLCREQSAKLSRTPGYALGSTHRDKVRFTKSKATAFGGLGADRLTARGSRSTLIGGFGADRLFVAGNKSVADAGVGNDVLMAKKKATVRALLVGGEGRDTMRGSAGASVLDARDGSGRDRVVCRSSRTLVLADRGDKVSGPCKRIVRTSS